VDITSEEGIINNDGAVEIRVCDKANGIGWFPLPAGANLAWTFPVDGMYWVWTASGTSTLAILKHMIGGVNV
jgi:hypothetical protein